MSYKSQKSSKSVNINPEAKQEKSAKKPKAQDEVRVSAAFEKRKSNEEIGGTQSVGGGRDNGMAGLTNSSRHFNEASRLKDVFKLYTTLEERPMAEDIDDDDDEDSFLQAYTKQQAAMMGIDGQSMLAGIESSKATSTKNQNANKNRFVEMIRKFLIGRLFKMNHVLLDAKGVNQSLYLIFMLFQFLQKVFFVFFNVKIQNEFSSNTAEIANSNAVDNVLPTNSSLSSNTSAIGTNISANLNSTNLLDDGASSTVTVDRETTFFLSDYLRFTNFHLYIFDNRDKSTAMQSYDFNILYFTLFIQFAVLLIIMYGLANPLYRQAKQQGMKEGTKYFIKLIAMALLANLMILQIPLTSVMFQGYLCDESTSNEYTLLFYQCGSSFNILYMIISTITLVVYLAFLIIESLIFTSCDFMSAVPWASIDQSTQILKIAAKLVISIGFMIGKTQQSDMTNSQTYVGIAMFLIYGVVTFRRLTHAIIFNKIIFRAQATEEIMVCWLYLCISIHQVIDVRLCVFAVIVIFAFGFFLSYLLITHCDRLLMDEALEATGHHETNFATNQKQALRILYGLRTVLDKSFADQKHQMILSGTFMNHLASCPVHSAADVQVAQSIALGSLGSSATVTTCMCIDQISGYEKKQMDAVYYEWRKDYLNGVTQYPPNYSSGNVKSFFLFNKPEANPEYRTMNHNTKRRQSVHSKNVADIKKQMASTTSKLLDLIAEEEEGQEQTLPDEYVSTNMRSNLNQMDARSGGINPEGSNLRQSRSDEDGIIKMTEDDDTEEAQAENQQQRMDNQDEIRPSNSQQDDNAKDATERVILTTNEDVAQGGNNMLLVAKNNKLPAVSEDNVMGGKGKSIAMPTLKTSKLRGSQSSEHIKPSSITPRRSEGQERRQLSVKYADQQNLSDKDDKNSNEINRQLRSENDLDNEDDWKNDPDYEITDGTQAQEVAKVEELPQIDLAQLAEAEMGMKFEMYAIFIEKCTRLFPRSIDIYIQSSLFWSSKLNNMFKALFHLMKAELCDPSMKYRFFIFRRRFNIEQMALEYNQQNLNLGQRVDPLMTYRYEKLFQRFTKLQYLAANSALIFWRELLQRHIDAAVLQKRGAEISRFYEKIQDIAVQLQQILPNEIKFLHQYAIFLKEIVNNESEANSNFEKAIQQYQIMVSTKNLEGLGDINEQTLYGENKAVGVIMVALEAERVGTVIHINDEICRTLGHERKNVIGGKINSIQPGPVAMVHDKILSRFLNTTRRTVLNHNLELFAMTSDGFLRPIYIIVKLYPQLSDRIVIVGYVQCLKKLNGIELPKQTNQALTEEQLLSLPHHYVLCDEKGCIHAITEGLWHETGLSCKFFKPGSTLSSRINVEDLLDFNLGQDDFQEQVSTVNGVDCFMDTRKILEYINIEDLSAEELAFSKAHIGYYRCNIKKVRLEFAFWCIVDLYRVVLYPLTNKLSMVNRSGGLAGSLSGEEISNSQSVESSDAGGNNMNSQVSMSSSSSDQHRGRSSSGNDKMISDLKAVIQKRDTPRYLLMLSRILFMAITVLIILQIIEYQAQKSFLASTKSMSDEFTLIESRLLKYVMLTMNIRSFANIGNNLEFDNYNDNSLKRIQRFTFLSSLIQKEQSELQDIENDLQTSLLKDKGQSSQNALSDSGASGKSTSKSSDLQSDILYLSQVSTREVISNFSIPFKFGLSTYLNNILNLNISSHTSLTLPEYLIVANPFVTDYSVPQLSQNSTYRQRQQDLWFTLVNGLRGILDKLLESRAVFHSEIDEFSKNQQVVVLVSIMVAQIMISSLMVGFLFHQVVQTERSKQDIMSIFSLLSTQDVKEVYDTCDSYIERFDEGAEYKELLNPSKLVYNESDSDKQLSASSSSFPIMRTGIKSPANKFKYSLSKKQEEEKTESHSENDLDRHGGFFFQNGEQTRDPSSKWFGLGTAYRPYYGRMIKRLGQLIKGDRRRKKKREAQQAQMKTENAHLIEHKVKGGRKRNDRNSMASSDSVEVKGKKTARSKKMEQVMGIKGHGKESGKTQRIHAADKLGDVFNGKVNPNKRLKRLEGELKKIDEEMEKHPHSDNDDSDSDSYSDEDSQGRKGKKHGRRHHKQRAEQQEQQRSIQEQIMQEEEIKNRGRMLQDSSKQGRKAFWKSILLNGMIASIFYTVFLYNYLFHLYKLNQFQRMESYLPLFYRRHSDQFLSFAFMRERVINMNENSKSLGFSLPKRDEYLNSKSIFLANMIEEYYHQSSMIDESEIQRLRVTQPMGMDSMLNFESLLDSDQYCQAIFSDSESKGLTESQLNELLSISPYTSLSIPKLRLQAFQVEIDTIIATMRAAAANDVQTLRLLAEKGVDLGKCDYDKRAPLHLAAANNSVDAVAYLVSQGVNVNVVDRWGATPLNQGQNNPQIAQLLRSKGAVLGVQQQQYKLQRSFGNDDQYRLFFAAKAGDVPLMHALMQIGWDVNGQDMEGRTALAIAASTGQLNAVKFLLTEGAEVSIYDARGFDPLDEAIRENRLQVADYLVSSVLVKQSCSNFESGLFNKGLSQTFGYFHKKFSDLQILANQANGNKTFLYQLLGNQQFLPKSDQGTTIPTSTLRTFQVFHSTQELYLNKVVDLMIYHADQSLHEFANSYFIIVTVVFYLFISIQVITLLLLRSKLITSLKNDVMQSRGILNLVPNSFFRKNQEAVEKVYKSMRI